MQLNPRKSIRPNEMHLKLLSELADVTARMLSSLTDHKVPQRLEKGMLCTHLEKGWGGQSRECRQSALLQSSGKSWSQSSWNLFLGTWRRCLGIISVDLPRGNGAWLTWLPFVMRWLGLGMRGEQKVPPVLTLAILLIWSAMRQTELSVVKDGG